VGEASRNALLVPAVERGGRGFAKTVRMMDKRAKLLILCREENEYLVTVLKFAERVLEVLGTVEAHTDPATALREIEAAALDLPAR
jgi:hypothetical protein